MIFIGVDIGGTFTDFVIYQPGTEEISTFKLLSTPEDPSKAVIQGIRQITAGNSGDQQHFTCTHGSTVATNALLERKGARTALVTTAGFKDILQIGRQNRSALYDLFLEAPSPLIFEDHLYEVIERVDSKGNVLTPLDSEKLDDILVSIKEQAIESVAVSLLFSFLHPEHEEIIARKFDGQGFHISISSKILPEFREYERTSTTAVNAYVSPILERYLQNLAFSLGDMNLRVMQSNGGMISIGEAQKTGVRCILSGPAGGVIGADFISRKIETEKGKESAIPQKGVKLITFDMGGTSTDVSLINGTPSLTSDANVAGYPIRIPMLDIHTIGAGGGSIAYKDKGGALIVGPKSAGADPGPACYGKGMLPTVTDAHVVLGRIIPDMFLGGTMPLDKSRSMRALSILADDLGIDLNHTALGIIAIANAHMARALQVISVERGHDPREFFLVAFGGAGGLHASDLARMVGIRRMIISPYASTLSALGMLVSDVVKDYVQTVMLPGETPHDRVSEAFKPMVQKIPFEFAGEGFADREVEIHKSMDMRYKGQSYEINVPFSPDFLEYFEKTHQALYGYSNPNFSAEIVNLRVRAEGKIPKPRMPTHPASSATPDHALIGAQAVIFPQGENLTPIYRGEELKYGHHLKGPALIVRSDTTILINPQDECEIDEFLNVIVTLDPIAR